MGRFKKYLDEDRYLVERGNRWHYKRRVPDHVVRFDHRAPMVRTALKTKDKAEARIKRNELEAADDAYWAELSSGTDSRLALDHYTAAVKRAEAVGFMYRSTRAMTDAATVEEIWQRFYAVRDSATPTTTVKAVLGHEEVPAVTVTEAFKLYVEKIAREDTAGKSEYQYKLWYDSKKHAVDNFVAVVSDKAMSEITVADANKFKDFWRERIFPKGTTLERGKPYAPNSGNRDLQNMRTLFREYFKHIGQKRDNPFDGLNFKDKKGRSRPPYPVEWITDKILKPGALASLNDEARGIVMAMIETGARPSELASLQPEHIVLDSKVPHVFIKETENRQLKTELSIRKLPLVGVALAVFRKHPNGFPRYYDNNNSLSAVVNKHFTVNDLIPPPDPDYEKKHTAYSLRHSFKDRMERAGFSDALQLRLMGHAYNHPKYGQAGGIEWHQEQLLRLALPFDPSIV